MTASQPLKQLASGEPLNMDVLGPEGQRSSRALGLVDFIMRPHYTSLKYPYITDELLQKVANMAGHTLYALDNDSALKINDDSIEVVGKGEGKQFEPES